MHDDDLLLPWFPFYYADFEFGETVSLASYGGQIAYVKLMGRQFRKGSLPKDIRALAKLIKMPVRLVKQIEAAFPVCEDGRRRNPRMQVIREEQFAKHRAKVEAGRRGGRTKAKGKQSPSTAKAPLYHSDADAEPDTDTEDVRTSSKAGENVCNTCFPEGEHWGLVKHLVGTAEQVACKCPRGRQRAKRYAQEQEAKESGRRPRRSGERAAPSKIDPRDGLPEPPKS